MSLILRHIVLEMQTMAMTSDQLSQYLLRLGLSLTEAGQMLSVSPRTVRRWQDGEEIPGPAQQAIRAWVRLHERHLPWRPDSVSIAEDDQDQITRHRSHTIDLAAVLEHVEARGGAKAPWTVDWDSCRASLETMEVSFYKLQSGSFSLGTYRRTDSAPDMERDRAMIEDAVYCIAKALERKSPDYGPVTLVVHDGPSKGRVARQQLREFRTANAAVEQICKDLGTPGFYEPFIMTKEGELLWDPRELQRECVRRSNGPRTLAVLATYVRTNAHFSFRMPHAALGPPSESGAKITSGQSQTKSTNSPSGPGMDRSVSAIRGSTRSASRAGFFPQGRLVSDVAFALEGVTS